MSTDIQKIRKTVKEQLEQTDKVIASNEAIAELVSRTNSTLEAGFSGLAYGLQELCYGIDDGFREVRSNRDSYLDLLRAEQIANNVYKKSVEAYNKNVEEWINVKNATIAKLRSQENTIYGEGKGSGFGIGMAIGWVLCLGSCVAGAVNNSPGVVILSPIIGAAVGYVSCKVFKRMALDPIQSKIEKENLDIARLQDLKKK